MLINLNVGEFLNKLESGSATPGGGSASAFAGSMSAALLSMVMRVSIRKLSNENKVNEFNKLIEKCDKISKRMALLMDKDADAFDKVINAFKLPKRTSNEKSERKAKVQIALKGASLVPLKVMEIVLEIANCEKKIVDFIPGSVISDIGVSNLLAMSALSGACYNVKINLRYIKDYAFNDETSRSAEEILSQATEILEGVRRKINKIVEGEV